MAKPKYCYVIVEKENGKMILDCSRFPIFYMKKVAKDHAIAYSDKCIVHRMSLEKLETLIIRGRV